MRHLARDAGNHPDEVYMANYDLSRGEDPCALCNISHNCFGYCGFYCALNDPDEITDDQTIVYKPLKRKEL